jgi:hypothetical protein
MVTKKRCAKLKISEVSDTFSDELESSEVIRSIVVPLKKINVLWHLFVFC